MIKRRINNTVLLITLNGLLSILVILLYKYISSSFSIDSILIWLDEYTKKFTLSAFVLFIILMLTAKVQLRVIETFRKSYPLVLTVMKYSYVFLLSAILAMVTSYYMEYFQMLEDPVATLQWIEGKTRIYLAGALFLYFIYLLLFALIGNFYISSIITSLILFVIGFVHFNKLSIRVEPLYPSDFSEVTQLKDVIPMIKDYLPITKLLLIAIAIIVLLSLVKFLPKVKLSILSRVILLLLTAGMVYSSTFYTKTFMKKFVEKSNVTIVQWNQLDNYNINGFIFGFISNLQSDAFEEPKGYSKEKVFAVAKKYHNKKNNDVKAKDLPKHPNIIYVMNEAFWDPTKLTNVQLSEDPMKHLRMLMEDYSSGNNLSPTYGGDTANVELEALTGFSNYFLKTGSIPYQNLIDRKSFIPTIVSDLEGKGYRTLAIHPYNKVFYKRDKVYQTFGFDQFIDMDTIKHQKKSGPYISDESLSKEIIDQLRKQKKPLFIHAVTIQNHFPYLPYRYEKNTVSVSGLSQESNGILEVYSEGIKQADEALQLLVDELDKLNEPTIVVFWGDHMPALGQNKSVYNEAKYSNNDDSNLYEKEFSETPLLIYSNYHLENQKLNTVSPIYFGPTVFEMAGLKRPAFYNLLDELKEVLPGLKSTIQIDGNQKFVTNHLTKKQKQLLKDYQLLEYDLLVGKQYSKDLLFNE